VLIKSSKREKEHRKDLTRCSIFGSRGRWRSGGALVL
jgi:hypothetical protein